MALPAYEIRLEYDTPSGKHEYQVVVKNKFTFILQFNKAVTIAKLENNLQDAWQAFKQARAADRLASQKTTIEVFINQADKALSAAATVPPPEPIPTPPDEI